jgi:hypothetical protein
MSQTLESEAKRLLNLLESMSVKDLKQLHASFELWLTLIDKILGKATK